MSRDSKVVKILIWTIVIMMVVTSFVSIIYSIM